MEQEKYRPAKFWTLKSLLDAGSAKTEFEVWLGP